MVNKGDCCVEADCFGNVDQLLWSDKSVGWGGWSDVITLVNFKPPPSLKWKVLIIVSILSTCLLIITIISLSLTNPLKNQPYHFTGNTQTVNSAYFRGIIGRWHLHISIPQIRLSYIELILMVVFLGSLTKCSVIVYLILCWAYPSKTLISNQNPLQHYLFTTNLSSSVRFSENTQ
jgi:hypothetical protein